LRGGLRDSQTALARVLIPQSLLDQTATRLAVAWSFLLGIGFGAQVGAQVAIDEVGGVARLREAEGAHWVWIPDMVLRRSALFDGDTGQMLGMIDSGMNLTPKAPQWSHERGEIYSVDRIYTRMHHGEMKDFVFVIDDQTLEVIAEIELPARVADTATGIALLGMLDGDRFLAVLNTSPGSSVSIVDLEERKLVTEIQTAGCAGIYPAGPRRFGMLCGNGTAITVALTNEGELDLVGRSKPFFDVVADPVSEKGVRDGSRWLYTTFRGQVHVIDYAAEIPEPSSPWSLFSHSELEAGWRPGGAQYLAYHRPTKRLYSLVHKGRSGSHKEPGREVWAWDVETRSRVLKFPIPNLLVAFIRPQVGFEAGGVVDWLLRSLLPNEGAHSIVVTQDDDPVLFVRNLELGAASVLDADNGEHIRDLEEIGFAGALLVVP
jgi:methylamine dehydrogenase heavy chain